MAAQLGGTVASGHKREFGRAEVEVLQQSALFEGVWQQGKLYSVWMSHGDAVTGLPAGFSRIAASENAPLAAIADEARTLLRRPVSSRSRAYAGRCAASFQFCP